jgi:hypothetical protein
MFWSNGNPLLFQPYMFRLERVQYRGIRLALGLVCSTSNNSLGVLSGIPPLPERFVYLNSSRHLVAVFYRLGHPLREKLRDLGTMNMIRCIQGYSNVWSMDVTPAESFTRYELSALVGIPLVHMHMKNALAGVWDTMYLLVTPRELSVVTSEYVESAVFYTDGSFIEGSVGFAIHRTGKGGCGFKLLSPAGVFSAKLSTLFMALRHIREVIQPPKKCLILTDSLSWIKAMLSRRISWRTHPLVYDLMRDFIEMKLIWTPSHVELVGNELVDGRGSGI